MRLRNAIPLLLAFAPATLLAADPPKVDPAQVVKLVPGKATSATVGRKCILTIETTAKKVTWRHGPEIESIPLDGKRLAVWADAGVYTLTAMVPSGDDVLSTEVILTVVGPRPPPVPPAPDPKPVPPSPDPKPVPVTSFRVIWVIESGDNTRAAVADAKAVRDYLTANCTAEGQWAGWRRFDPQQEAANETPIMKALWVAVKPNLTVSPAVAIEVNGKVEILPYPASAADALALFKKYNGGK